MMYLINLFILFLFFRILLGIKWLWADEKHSFWHHFYTGAFIFLFGHSLITAYSYPHPLFFIGVVFLLIGGYLMVDDLYQHWRQKRDHSYLSPVHYMGAGLYKWRSEVTVKYKWLVWLNWF